MQNHNATWHHNVFYNYAIINMNLYFIIVVKKDNSRLLTKQVKPKMCCCEIYIDFQKGH
jgi:hypothetical protein